MQVGRALLGFMRPRSSVGSDSQPDEDAAIDSDKDTPRPSSISADQVVLTSDKKHESKSPSPAAVDQVYELNKAEIGDPKDEARQAGSGQYELFRTFVHGLEYVNELVMMADNHSAYFILQDANYNVIALVDDPAYADFMTDYDPYGQMRLRADQPGGPWIPHEYNPADPRLFYDLPGFQGGTQDRETGLICFGARCYDPDLGRWLQTDPNGTGLVLGNALRFHGQSPVVFSLIAVQNQQSDGLNHYLLARNNPNTGLDPTGLAAYFDWMAESEEMESDVIGHRLYALGTINEGARWASLGLQTTLDIAGSLLGIDVFKSVMVLADGRGGFWESMDVVMALVPFSGVGKATLKAAKAGSSVRKWKWAAKAGKYTGRFVGHHTVPRAVLGKLRAKVANHPLVRGAKGKPNIWPIPEELHKDIHHGANGGLWNLRWDQEIKLVGDYLKADVKDITRIRDKLVKEFGLEDFQP